MKNFDSLAGCRDEKGSMIGVPDHEALMGNRWIPVIRLEMVGDYRLRPCLFSFQGRGEAGAP